MTPTQDPPPCSHPTHRRQNAQRHCAGCRNLSGRWRLRWRRSEPRWEWKCPSSAGAKTANWELSFFGTARETVNGSGNSSKPCPRIKLLSQRTQNQPSAPPAQSPNLSEILSLNGTPEWNRSKGTVLCFLKHSLYIILSCYRISLKLYQSAPIGPNPTG